MFDLAMSLGGNCQTRYNISRTLYLRREGNLDGFRLGENANTANDYGSFFFDWSISPATSVTKIIERDFTDCLSLENLRIETTPSGKFAIRDTHTGCLYPHIIPNADTENDYYHNLLTRFSVISSKYRHLAQKTKATLKDAKLAKLLVVNGHNNLAEILNLYHAISAYAVNFSFLYAHAGAQNDNTKALQDAGIIVHPIAKAPYPGDFNSWDEALSGVELKDPNQTSEARSTDT